MNALIDEMDLSSGTVVVVRINLLCLIAGNAQLAAPSNAFVRCNTEREVSVSYEPTPPLNHWVIRPRNFITITNPTHLPSSFYDALKPPDPTNTS